MNEKKNVNDSIYSFLKKVDFECKRCSDCCRHDPGAVFLTENDVKKISKHLNISTRDLLIEYCRGLELGERTVTSLKEKPNYDCIFWNDSCLIYEARPLQCRTYPFWPFLVESEKRWQEESKRCKGIGSKSSLSTEEKYKMYKLEKDARYYDYNLEVSEKL